MNERPHELINAFPEVQRDFILPKLRELEVEITTLKKAIKRQLQEIGDMDDAWFVEEVIKAFNVSKLLELEARYNRLGRYLPIKESKGRLNPSAIERARTYPIVKLAEELLGNVKRCGSTYRGLCPFHQEKTPSFYLYSDSNRYHCFGCQAHGDVIDLAQKLNNLSFVEAVNYLS